MGYYPLSLILGTDPEKTLAASHELVAEGILENDRGFYRLVARNDDLPY